MTSKHRFVKTEATQIRAVVNYLQEKGLCSKDFHESVGHVSLEKRANWPFWVKMSQSKLVAVGYRCLVT